MKILILGNGWLAKRMKQYFVPRGIHTDVFQGRLSAFQFVDAKEFDVIINTAAKTNIDWCEKNKRTVLDTNAVQAAEVAEICKAAGKRHVFISSACIFESLNELDWKNEDAVPNPGCFYALSKWVGEELVKEACPESLILRIRLPISAQPHPRNTITKILSYSQLQQNQESWTVIEDFLEAFEQLLLNNAQGTFHLINKGTLSPYEIAAYYGLSFRGISKQDMDDVMLKAGRARRVTTLVRSTKIPPLPDITWRIIDLLKEYKTLV